MRVGIFGGSFDPIHLGHLLIAEEARIRLCLEEVVFIPTGLPWMKADRHLSTAHHRLNMVRLAIASNPFFRPSSVEIDRPGPSYTVDTLEALREESGGEDEFFFMLGTDSFREFHRWKEPSRILALSTLAVVPRPGYDDPEIERPNAANASVPEKVVRLVGPVLDISGTEIRSRVARGLSVHYQVPEEVERYLFRYGLYRDAEVGQ